VKEREYNFTVEVLISSDFSKAPRVVPAKCCVTPNRIYTVDGAVFDRATGKQIMPLRDRVWGTYRRKAVPESIRDQSPSV
jgi:hypothetical protein